MKVLGINGSHRAGKGTAALLQAARFPRPASTTAEGRERSRAGCSVFPRRAANRSVPNVTDCRQGFRSLTPFAHKANKSLLTCCCQRLTR